MKVFRVSITLFELLKLGFMFQNSVFKPEKLDVLCINFMKDTSIRFTLVSDVVFFSIVYLFHIHPNLLENITEFFLRPNTKNVGQPFHFLVKSPNSSTCHFILPASFNSFKEMRIVNPTIEKSEVLDVISCCVSFP